MCYHKGQARKYYDMIVAASQILGVQNPKFEKVRNVIAFHCRKVKKNVPPIKYLKVAFKEYNKALRVTPSPVRGGTSR